MDFKDSVFIKDLMSYEGPLLSIYTNEGKTYLVSWVDVEEFNVWLVVEVEQSVLDLYLAKAITMLEVEERSPNLYLAVRNFDMPLVHIEFETLRDDWKAPDTSYYDPDLLY